MPLANYSANLKTAVGALQELGIHNIVLITPPPVGVKPGVKNPVSLAHTGFAAIHAGCEVTAHTGCATSHITGSNSGVKVVDAFVPVHICTQP